MKPAFDGQLEVCFMDTDSFLYQIYVADIDNKLAELSDYFDFSNYSEKHHLYSDANKDVPGR